MSPTPALSARRAVVAAVMVAVALTSVIAAGQQDEPEPANLAAEVARLQQGQFHRAGDRPVVVFTGSSSIRLWQDAQAAFPRVQLVNTGFGGSTLHNLVAYGDPLILRYRPDQVVIHEGDNDLATGATPAQIMGDARALVRRIRQVLPRTEVVLISAKPSVARWRYHDLYRDLNARYERLALRRPRVSFVDVWSRMLDADGVPRTDLYGDDGLHMTPAGYRIWHRALATYLVR